jgi:hypothetical protein
MGFLFETFTLTNILGFLLFFISIVLINELTRRSLKLSILVFVVLPILLAIGIYFGFLGSPTGKTWFAWVKVVSALAGVYGFLLIRFSKWGKGKFACYFPISIMALNIIEAVYRELQVFATYKTLSFDAGGVMVLGGYWNILNALAGILCIVTLTGFMGVRASNDKTKDMIWPDMTWMYVIGYTIWNFTYVYNCISNRSMYAGVGILAAALFAELIFKQGAWFQHRAQTLSVYVMFSLSFDFLKWPMMNIAPTYSITALSLLSIASFGLNLLFFLAMIMTIIKHKKNPLKEEINVHTKYYKKTILVNNL